MLRLNSLALAMLWHLDTGICPVVHAFLYVQETSFHLLPALSCRTFRLSAARTTSNVGSLSVSLFQKRSFERIFKHKAAALVAALDIRVCLGHADLSVLVLGVTRVLCQRVRPGYSKKVLNGLFP